MAQTQSRFGVFLPEFPSFRKKDNRACRELLGDVALIDVTDGRVVASRGRRFEKDLPLDCFAPVERRTLFPDAAGCFLLFPELLPATGLSLVLFFQKSAPAISAALRAIQRPDVCAAPSSAAADPMLCDLLSELFFYLDGLLCASENLPLWTALLRASNLAGCKLRSVRLPRPGVLLSPEEAPAVIAFLLCYFLTVRREGAESSTEEDTDTPDYRIRLTTLHNFPLLDEEFESTLPARDAFRGFRFFTQNGRPTALLSLSKRPGSVSSGRRKAPAFLLLECTACPALSPLRGEKRRFLRK